MQAYEQTRCPSLWSHNKSPWIYQNFSSIRAILSFKFTPTAERILWFRLSNKPRQQKIHQWEWQFPNHHETNTVSWHPQSANCSGSLIFSMTSKSFCSIPWSDSQSARRMANLMKDRAHWIRLPHRLRKAATKLVSFTCFFFTAFSRLRHQTPFHTCVTK